MSSNDSFDPVEAATDGNARGFPLGYFIIRSLATGKVLDVVDDGTADGTELILYNEKDSTLVETLRKREYDNQVRRCQNDSQYPNRRLLGVLLGREWRASFATFWTCCRRSRY